MPFFNGWDVAVRTNSSVISPISVTFAGDLFEANYSVTPVEAANCVNNVANVGSCRAGIDGPGVAHSVAAFLGKPSAIAAPIDGTLLIISYNVTGASGFSRIDIVDNTFSNGTSTPVPHQPPSPGIFGTEPPEFIVSANPPTLTVLQGFNATTMITVSSASGFTGAVSLNASEEFGAVFAQTVLNLTPNGSNSTKLTLIAPWSIQAQDYPQVTITASNRVHSSSAFVDVNVKTRDFLLAINPSILRIHAGTFANSTITLQSLNGFSGDVSLNVQIPTNVTYVLGSSIVALLANATSHTSLNVSTPIVFLPFGYTINVTARATLITSGTTRLLSHVQSLIIKPPQPSFAISVNPATIVVRAGLTSIVTITVMSVDYFWQYLYLSATMSGGTASFDTNSYYVPLPNSKYANVTESANFTLSVYVPIDQVPGHYIVLLTVYQSPLTQTIGIPVIITSLSPFHNVSNPTILGLSPPIYFGILGALVIPFIALSVYTYRKAREEEDEDWKA